jgi:flagellar biosynthetic protein FlhB
MVNYLGSAGTRELTAATTATMMMEVSGAALLAVVPVTAAAAAAGTLGGLLQTGLAVSPNVMSPDFSRIDPMAGARRIFSRRALIEMVKAIAKVGVVGYLVFQGSRGDLVRLMSLGEMPIAEAGRAALSLAAGMAMRAAFALLAIGVFDYLYQFYEFEMGLRMSKQEVKEETKETEGRPEVRSKIRERQRLLARKRMMAAVPKADVVIANPTHFAVALHYNPAKFAAPVCLARGADLLALKIREIARRHGVPIVENPPLAQALYRSVDVGHAIPSDLYRAVAEVLAFVYRLKGRMPA